MGIPEITSLCTTTVAKRPNKKLSTKEFGPEKVIQRLRKVAYKLKIPSAAQIYPIFHVLLLKKRIGENDIASVTLPAFELLG